MEKRKVFVIMPFEERFFEIYEMLKRKFEENFEFSHAGDEDNQQNILKDIIQAIYESDIIIANLTGLNPNVFYELGVAHTLNKKVIIITEDISTLPFDLKSYRAKEYSTHFVKFEELIDSLDKYMTGAITGDITYSNPVSDFLNTKSETEIVTSIIPKGPSIMLDEDTDKGFLDYLAGIEENMEQMTSYVNSMNNDMQTMSAGIAANGNEIQRVNEAGGSGSISFVRKKAKVIAKYIEVFDANLRSYNQKYTDLWSTIEKDTLGLLKSRYATHNAGDLITFINGIKTMKTAILESSEAVKSMKASTLKGLGMERTLNQAIKFLNDDLANYLSIMDDICCSIDRIVTSSQFVLDKKIKL